MKIKKILLIVLVAAFGLPMGAQVKIGNRPGTIDPSSLLELESATQGLRLPRIKLTDVKIWGLAGKDPVSGMMIFNEGGEIPNGLYYWRTEDPQQWTQVVNKAELSTLIANYLTQNTSVRDSIIKLINNTINNNGIEGKNMTSKSDVLKVLNGAGAAIKAVQVDLDKNELGHLLNTSPLTDSLSVAISNSTIIRDSIKSVVNNTIVAGDIKGKDVTSNSAVIKVLNGAGAAIKAVQVDLDKNELGHLLNTSPLTDSLSIAISKSTVIRDSITSIMRDSITSMLRDSITSVLKTNTTNTLAGGSGKLTSTVNGVSADLVPAGGVVAKTLGFDAGGNLVSQLIAAGTDASINTDRPITLAGTSATGKNLGAGGKTMAEFFEAFFFPSLAATPPASSLTTATLTFPYSIWRNWGNPPSKNIDFAWSVTNVSLTDNTDDKAITSIKLKSGAAELANVTPLTGGNQTGTFSAIPFANTVLDAKTPFTKTYTLEVMDAQPQTVLKNVVLTMSAAIPLTYGAPTLTPATLVYEYENDNKDITLNWSITPNDEGISSISVNGTLTGSKPASGSQAIQLKSIPNGGTQTQVFPLIVTGIIYGAGASKNSPAVSWDNRLYRGVFNSSIRPDAAGFTFTDDDVKALTESQLGGDWKAAAGYEFVCTGSGQYMCFAYPDDNQAVDFQAKSDLGFISATPEGFTVITRPNFVNKFGYSGTNYKLVFFNNELGIGSSIYKIQNKK